MAGALECRLCSWTLTFEDKLSKAYREACFHQETAHEYNDGVTYTGDLAPKGLAS